MVSEKMPPFVANLKVKSPGTFIFFINRLIQKRLPEEFSFDDLLVFLGTTQEEVLNFYKSKEVPIDWILRLARIKNGKSLLKSFGIKYNSRIVGEDYLDTKVDHPDPAIELIETDNHLKDSEYLQTGEETMTTTTENSIIGGTKDPKGMFISDKHVNSVLDDILLLSNFKSDSEIGKFLNKKHRNIMNAIRKSRQFLYLSEIVSVAKSDHVFMSEKDFLTELGLIDFVALDEVSNKKKDPEKIVGKIDPKSVLGGINETGAHISTMHVKDLVRKILQLSNFKSIKEIGKFLNRNSDHIRRGTSLLYVKEVNSIAESSRLLVSRDEFFSILGLNPVATSREKNSIPPPPKKKAVKKEIEKEKEKKEAAPMEEILPMEIENILRIALLTAGSITDVAVRKEYFVGCLFTRLSSLYDMLLSDDNILFEKKGTVYFIDLTKIPFELK